MEEIEYDSGEPEGVKGRSQTSSVFIAPLFAPAGAKTLLAGKTSYGQKSGNLVAPIWRDTA